MASHDSSSVASELEGALLISGGLFPYFFLVALEAGGPLRAAVLLAVYPFVSIISIAFSEDLALQVMTFAATAGLRADNVKAVATATLSRFFLEDLREGAFRALSRHAGKKYVVTRLPRVMVEPFFKGYVDTDVRVVGTELRVVGRWFSGLVAPPGIVAGGRSLAALLAVVGDDQIIDVGLCSSGTRDQPPFLHICQERRMVSTPEKASATPLTRSEYPRPLIFHDGRLVARPDPLACFVVLLWVPLGAMLAVTRILIGMVFPSDVSLLLVAATGFQIRAQLCTTDGEAPAGERQRGTLYACNHQTLMDPVILSTVLNRRVLAVTYSLSGFSELISPIPTVRLSRDRAKDRLIMQSLLVGGDLVVCPEGTTCREPYLLRFSPLFAEIASRVTPVAIQAKGTMFYGTTVRGYKCLDSFFFLMNPAPWYQLLFLPPVSCPADGGATSSRHVANSVQRMIGCAVGFECTGLTRKDKYRMLAGHDGVDARSR